MPRNGALTREKILDITHDMVLDQGFSGTSIDSLIARAGITKGAFFYHFKSKADLALALVERFAASEETLIKELMQKAERLSRDPLQQVLIYIGLYEEMFRENQDSQQGCLLASFCYERDLFDDGVREVCAVTLAMWRDLLAAKIEEAVQVHPPREAIDPAALADHILVVIEGAFILARTYQEPGIMARQIAVARRYVELLFNQP